MGSKPPGSSTSLLLHLIPQRGTTCRSPPFYVPWCSNEAPADVIISEKREGTFEICLVASF